VRSLLWVQLAEGGQREKNLVVLGILATREHSFLRLGTATTWKILPST
jgi:hypothetical protein